MQDAEAPVCIATRVFPFAYVLGSALLSTAIFVLCALRIAGAPVFAEVTGLDLYWPPGELRRAWRVDDGHRLHRAQPKKWWWMLLPLLVCGVRSLHLRARAGTGKEP